MSKAKRLMELMMVVNRKRRFTVKELAQEFGVSSRTILRDLQELSELGVPLYSEVGPHGGYEVLNERVLPPIAFAEEEAVAIFFTVHALRHFSSLPFQAESSSVNHKFYSYMPEDVKERIDQLKNRFDFEIPMRPLATPYLAILLQTAIKQQVLSIEYETSREKTRREIQPIGVYARDGFWYCPSYCFLREDMRLFRCDRMTFVTEETARKPLNLRHVHLKNWQSYMKQERNFLQFHVELTKDGIQRCFAEQWLKPHLHIRTDGSGWLEGSFPESEIPYFAQYFIGFAQDATVKQPVQLVSLIKNILTQLLTAYHHSR
ncbi:Predicted DNA-binding transcriptional regulator YafY, contains an HTH and WYL domains [Evansella caseinilytica]|uniref:Predicted DNA-binding transcriptional regulator YafY, contains an HTH and WYL domains n=1 Tax=Evansella caseinilytica TaxID=1503961 RepID=A0A1H3TVH5_9BACI|nr:YafY family protein [Evansella caseinilytica]SDZ54122.1 Predicted DNA-binding transcriptional regulator YafY, contains an HTH and WYL domains [Evansella caseinilytica]